MIRVFRKKFVLIEMYKKGKYEKLIARNRKGLPIHFNNLNRRCLMLNQLS